VQQKRQEVHHRAHVELRLALLTRAEAIADLGDAYRPFHAGQQVEQDLEARG
jgi:hypothetical protein